MHNAGCIRSNTTNRSAQITINKSESINTQDMSLLGLFKIYVMQ